MTLGTTLASTNRVGRVLIVHDAADQFAAIAGAVAAEYPHARFTAAGSLPELAAALASDEPDLIVIDHPLRFADVLEVLRDCRLHLPIAGLIVLARDGGAALAAAVIKAGADEFVSTAERSSEHVRPAARSALERAATRRFNHEFSTDAHRLETLGRLAGGIAHNFNNLMTVVFGYAAVARKSLPGGHAAAAQALDRIEQAAQNASTVAAALLALNRGSTDEHTSADLGELVTESARLLRRAVPESIVLAVAVDAESPLLVRGNIRQLQQVILSLLLDACDVASGGGRVDVKLGRVPVEADGAGGAPQICASLQIEARASDANGARSIASADLAPDVSNKSPSIVRSIIKDHGGRLASDGGAGYSSFHVTLPVSVVARPSANVSAASAQQDGTTVLLAEPNQYLRDMLAASLRAHNHCVLEAVDRAGLHARLREQHAPVSLLVVDENLAGGGADAVAELRNHNCRLPTILMTDRPAAFDERNLDVHTIILGKPFPLSDLARLVSELLARRSRSEQTYE